MTNDWEKSQEEPEGLISPSEWSPSVELVSDGEKDSKPGMFDNWGQAIFTLSVVGAVGAIIISLVIAAVVFIWRNWIFS